jgi:hypothetical protein
MRFEIVELLDFSGYKAGIYTVILNYESLSIFDNFIKENIPIFPEEIDNILSKIETIGHETGAREHFFKLNEGTLGDGICALYDNPDKKIRLYCIRYGSTTIILGGGGYKNVRALQDDPKLKHENYLLRKISNLITKAIKEGDISWAADGKKLIGNLIIQDDEDNE